MKEVQGPKFEVSYYFRGRLKAIKAEVGVMNRARYAFYITYFVPSKLPNCMKEVHGPKLGVSCSSWRRAKAIKA